MRLLFAGALMAALAPAVAGPAEGTRVETLAFRRTPGRTVLTLTVDGEPAPADVRRVGRELLVTLSASLPESLALPEPRLPVEVLRVDRGPPLVLRLQVAENVPFETRQAGPTLHVSLPAPPDDVPSSRTVAELYPLIFPPPAPVAETAESPAGAAADEGGILLGPIRLHPRLTGTLVSSRVRLREDEEPVKATYYELQPGLGGDLAFRGGTLRLEYQPRLRFFSSFEEIEEPSHLVQASLDLPLLGPGLVLQARHRWARGILETSEVDPGREYFFDLARFTRNETTLGVRWETAARLVAEGDVHRNEVAFDDESGFFSFEERGAGLGLLYELTPAARATLRGGYSEVPGTEERPVAESDASWVRLGLAGEPLPLLTGTAEVGWERRQAPRAGPGGTRYHGLTVSASLTKEITRESRLTISANRQTQLSGFEDDAFYVTSSVQGDLAVSLPGSVSAHAGPHYRRNDYRTETGTLGEPRRDRILGWSVGAGRRLTRWALLRVDYTWERRRSNLDFYDTRTSSLLFHLGFGVGR